MKQHIFLRGEWVGSREIDTWNFNYSPPRPTNSYVLFCPECAEIWGKLMHEQEGSYCQPITSRCQKHAMFPSDATFTLGDCGPGWHDPRDRDDDNWPLAVKKHDLVSLINFILNHKDRYPYEPR